MANVRSLTRGLEILTVLSREGPLKARAIAARLEMPRSSVYRFLRTLIARQLIEVDSEGRGFALGSGILELAAEYRGASPLCGVVLDRMQELSEILGETVLLTVRSGNRAICVERIDPKDAVRLSREPKPRQPILGASASARALTGPLPESERERLVRTSAHRIAARAIASASRAHLARIRREGITVSASDEDRGMTALGIPIRNADNEVVACLSVTGAVIRLSARELIRTIALVTDYAAQISKGMALHNEESILGAKTKGPPVFGNLRQ